MCEVEFTQWTDDGRLRHPSFQGLRLDKAAKGVVIERAQSVEPSGESAETQGPPGGNGSVSGRGVGHDEATVAGVRISHPDREVFPRAGLTKLMLARYYESVSEEILKFIAGRALSTVRCPRGRQHKCFFQKHRRETFSDPVRFCSPLSSR